MKYLLSVCILTFAPIGILVAETDWNSSMGLTASSLKTQGLLESSLVQRQDNYYLTIKAKASRNFSHNDEVYRNSSKAEFREISFRDQHDWYNLTIGLQDLSWSETFGVNIMDIANPRDYTEFIFDDLANSKIPLWMGNLIFMSDKSSVQFIYAPFPKKDILPEAASTFDPLPESTRSLERRDPSKLRDYDDAEYGARASHLFDGGLDLSLLYYHYHTRYPEYALKMNPNRTVYLELQTQSLDSFGLSMTQTFSDIVLRADSLFTPLENDRRQIILGLDKTNAETQATYGLQLQNDSKYESKWGGVQGKWNFFDHHLDEELLVLKGLDNDDLWIRPKLKLSWLNAHSLELKYDYISGKTSGILGPLGHKGVAQIQYRLQF